MVYQINSQNKKQICRQKEEKNRTWNKDKCLSMTTANRNTQNEWS